MLKSIDEYPPIESLGETPHFILNQYGFPEGRNEGHWFATVVTEDGKVGIYRLPAGKPSPGAIMVIRRVGEMRLMIIS